MPRPRPFAPRTRPSLLVLVLALTTMVALVRPAAAFDQKRRGFVLEYGIGPSYSTYITYDYDSYPGASQVERMRLSGATRFRLGHGVSEQVTISYVNDLAYSLDDRNLYQDAFTMNVLSGIGARWYARPRTPSWHLEGAVGIASMVTPSGSSTNDRATGFGLEGGIGFEFSRSWSVSLVARRLSIDAPGYDRSAFDLILSHVVY